MNRIITIKNPYFPINFVHRYLILVFYVNLQKENVEKKKLLSELQKLCAYIIIFSDLEIEALFQFGYPAFNPEAQKKIFQETLVGKQTNTKKIKKIKL